MKSSLVKITVIVCSIITLNSCKSWSAISDDGDVLCSNYSYDEISVLSTDLVLDMINGYKNNQLAIINGMRMDPTIINGGLQPLQRPNPISMPAYSKTNNDARAMALPLEQIKEFMYHVERLVKINDSLIDSSKLGVRIYYATYPTNSKWNGYNGELEEFLDDPLTMRYQNLHTLIIIPTILNEGVMTDFDPRNPDTYLGNHEALLLGPNISAMSVSRGVASGTGNISAQNHGQLYPPYSGGNAF